VHCSAQKPDFPAVVLFSDEACFTRQEILSSHNSHVWAEEKPHAASVHCHQERFAVNVWAGIVPDCLIGVYLLPSWLSAQIYWVFLEEMLPEFLEAVSLSVRRNMWFQQDGAVAHFAHQV
jgi:hypothetical protein